MTEPHRVGDLCAALLQSYEVERETCERDVLGFLNDALREGVIRIVS